MHHSLTSITLAPSATNSYKTTLKQQKETKRTQRLTLRSSVSTIRRLFSKVIFVIEPFGPCDMSSSWTDGTVSPDTVANLRTRFKSRAFEALGNTWLCDSNELSRGSVCSVANLTTPFSALELGNDSGHFCMSSSVTLSGLLEEADPCTACNGRAEK